MMAVAVLKLWIKGKRSQGVKNSRQNVLIILRDSFSSELSLLLSTYLNFPNYQFFSENKRKLVCPLIENVNLLEN